MPIRADLWSTDPDNKPKPRQSYSDDTVGRLHSGTTETNAKGVSFPVALTEWMIRTDDMHVAEKVAEILGGTPDADDESPNENFISVQTAAESIPVIIDADGIDFDLKQWANSKLTHHCDGRVFLSHPFDDGAIGAACGCPELFAERKQRATAGMGPKPSITVMFRLAAAPDLGLFKWLSGSWSLASVLHEVANAMDTHGGGGPVLADLTLEQVSYVAKKGKMKGQTVEYTKPVITVKRAYVPDED